MYRYLIRFSKSGTICYISHLDLMRVFQRAIKKTGIKQSYSQGFNPHPKMGFGQPLSLGYTGLNEYMEFETEEEYDPDELKQTLSGVMPEGLKISECRKIETLKKTLASVTEAAEYIISVPLERSLGTDSSTMHDRFMSQSEILCLKKQKKKKDLAEIDIRPMIRNIVFTPEDECLFITAELDSGSVSNLSPELLIGAVCRFFGIETGRNEIEVMRTRIMFNQEIQ